MDFTVIGKYGPYAQKGGATSCYLINNSIILDMGSGSLSRLLAYTDFCGISAIILTHMHSDHICDMFILRYYLALQERAGKFCGKIPVYMPYHDCPENKILSSCNYFDIRYVKDKDAVNIGGVSAGFFAMRHAGIPCLGVKLTSGGKSLAYTADTQLCENLESLVKGCSAAICDSAAESGGSNGNSPHARVSDIAEICGRNNVYMYLSHISQPDEGRVFSEAYDFNKNCEVVQEGKKYTL